MSLTPEQAKYGDGISDPNKTLSTTVQFEDGSTYTTSGLTTGNSLEFDALIAKWIGKLTNNVIVQTYRTEKTKLSSSSKKKG